MSTALACLALYTIGFRAWSRAQRRKFAMQRLGTLASHNLSSHLEGPYR